MADLPPTRSETIKRLMMEGAHEGLAEYGAMLLEKAKGEVPKVTGRLHDSAEVRFESPDVIVVEFDAPYAAKVHEDVRAKHPHGGKSKYLEDPLKETLPEADRVIGGPIHKRFTSGGAVGRGG